MNQEEIMKLLGLNEHKNTIQEKLKDKLLSFGKSIFVKSIDIRNMDTVDIGKFLYEYCPDIYTRMTGTPVYRDMFWGVLNSQRNTQFTYSKKLGLFVILEPYDTSRNMFRGSDKHMLHFISPIPFDNKKNINMLLLYGKNTSEKIDLIHQDNWENTERKINKVSFNNMVLYPDVRKDLKEYLTLFKKSSDYTLGILMHGPSGTGKTTIIRAIASVLNMPIQTFSIKTSEDVQKIINSLHDNSIIAIEDIDKELSKLDREAIIGKLMQAFDGLYTPSHSIFVITTNQDPDEIFPEEMLRDGRFDLKLEICEWTRPMAIRYCIKRGLNEDEANTLLDQTLPNTTMYKPGSVQKYVRKYNFLHPKTK